MTELCFRKAIVVYDTRDLLTEHLAGTLPKFDIFHYVTDGTIKCCACNREGTIIVRYRHVNEPENVCHTSIFCVGSHGGMTMMTLDHVLPRMYGGGYQWTNLRPMCSNCNNKRATNLTQAELELVCANPDLYCSRYRGAALKIKKLRNVKQLGPNTLNPDLVNGIISKLM